MKPHIRAHIARIILPAALAALAACSEESALEADAGVPAPDGGSIRQEGDMEQPCPPGLSYDRSAMACRPTSHDSLDMSDGGGAGVDATDDDGGRPEEEEMGGGCDRDGDGDRSPAGGCGGMDCDDDDPRRASTFPEICDAVDNDCDEAVNDDITCTFIAHTPDDLYQVDPFQKTATVIAPMPQDVDNTITDIDTHPDGRLFGITAGALMSFDAGSSQWRRVGFGFSFGFDSPDNPNGLAIDQGGAAYVTAANALFRVDLSTGRSSRIGQTSGFVSSGDAVINKQNTLFMTARREGADDQLVEVNRSNASSTLVADVPGFDKVYGLTFAWGQLFGLTGDGELLTIDRATGQAELVHTFVGQGGMPLPWYGAASTPSR